METTITKTEPKQIKLSGNRTATVEEFKGKHIRQAQRISGEENDKLIFAIISTLTLIDGKPVTMEEIDEMSGGDVMLLMGEFGQSFTPRQDK